MLRALVLVLLLANAGFWVWRQGWLAPLHGAIGAHPEGEREPGRMARQVRPERVEILTPEAASAAQRLARAAAAPPATVCLEAGPYTATELAAVQPALQAAWPGGTWAVREIPAAGGGWWVVMGPFFDAEQLQTRRDELRRRGVMPEQASTPGAAPMLILSRHDNREAAELELTALEARDVQTARVIEGSPRVTRALRVAQADAPTQALLTGLAAERLRGKPFVPCRNPNALSER
ncbi:MAG: hypothetical protein H0W48_07780 [Methylibium sp.]|nr:hypothetical protein [Methylibium sp.]